MRFVIQRHRSKNLHWDFRLEHEGVLKSWAVPKGISSRVGEKRLAIEVEDHDLDYINFEGIIPKGSYGAGVVSIQDQGNYVIIKWKDDFIKIDLRGREFKGIYNLRKMNKDWLIWRDVE